MTTVSSGTTLVITAGQTSSGIVVDNGGFLEIQSGGVASGTVVLSGGREAVFSGGVASGGVISSGATEDVFSGGVASGTVVSSGGSIELTLASASVVWSAGSTNSIDGVSLQSGAIVASLDIAQSGSVSGFVVGTFDAVTVSSGGVASGTVVSSGGSEVVDSGGIASGTEVLSGGSAEVFAGGVASAGVVSSGGNEDVFSGGVASGTVVSSGGSIELTLASASVVWSAGGTNVIDGVTLQNGATVASLDIAQSGSISGFVVVGSFAAETVESGGVASGSVVSSGGFVTVDSGGIASGTVVLSGGSASVDGGGVASAGVVSSGGNEDVFSGGVASGTVVSSGGSIDLTLASASVVWSAGSTNVIDGVTLQSGAIVASLDIAQSGSVSGFVVGSFDAETVDSGGVASGTVVSSGGTVDVFFGGVASGTVVLSGGSASVDGGGVASAGVVSSGGNEDVFSGGVASGTVVSSGGSIELTLASASVVWSAGSTNVIDGVTLQSGAIVASLDIAQSGSVSGFVVGSFDAETVDSGGVASGTVVSSGGTVVVFFGGVASGTVVLSGGSEDVFAGGVASGGVVSSGGNEDVFSGGVASGTVVSSGGSIELTLASASVVWSAGGTNVIDGVALQNGAIVASLDIAQSGSVSGFVVASFGSETVDSGGVASGTVVNSGGNADVFFGGIASGTVVLSGGSEDVFAGGVASGGVVSSGGNEDVFAGGVASGTVVSSGGSIELTLASASVVWSAGSINSIDGVTLQSGAIVASLDIAQSGSISGFVVGRSDVETVDSGGVASGTVVSSVGTADVFSGGVASGTVVLSGGREDVFAGGVASGGIVSSGGNEFVDSGGVASGTVVSSGGFIALTLTSAYGPWSPTGSNVINGVTAQSGAIVSLGVGQGGSISGFAVLSGAAEDVDSGGVASGTVVSSGGFETVYSGGVASGTVVLSGGSATVDGGGVASGGVVSSGGNEDVSFAGVVSGTVVSSGGSIELTLASASVVWSSGSTNSIDGVSLQSGAIVASLDIAQSGSISGFVVGSFDAETVDSGGVASGTVVSSGGSEFVAFGGVASGTVVLGGGSETIASGGVASGVVVSSGGNAIIYLGGVASGSVVSSGGSLNVTLANAYGPWSPTGSNVIDGATAQSGAVVSLEIVQGGSISGFAVLSGAAEDVDSGGVALGTVVLSGGLEYVFSGGVASTGVVSSGGDAVIESGGVASGTVVSSGGSLNVTLANAYGPWSPTGSNVIDGVTAQSGAIVSLDIFQGGSISSFVVLSGAVEDVDSGGVASGTVVLSGGREAVFSGGVASGGVVSSGGDAIIESGGVASGTVVSSGGAVAVTLGSAYGAWSATGANVIDGVSAQSGAAVSLDIFQGGSISSFVVLSGAVEDVDFGGVDSGTVVSGGGLEVVFSGGSAVAPVIGGPGAVLYLAGGIVSGGISFAGSGGKLDVVSQAMPSNTISGFTRSGDTIDLTGLAFSGNTSVGFNAATDVLTVTEGGSSATIQLDAETYTGITWSARQDAGTGTEIVACFCRGTLILTDRGDVPVEELAIGDRVMTISGAAKPVKWLGWRSYDGRFVAGNRGVLPIRVAAGALADGQPARDLLVSPEHALYIPGSSPGTGALAPARLLVNGASIAQVERVEQIDYFHVELDAHDIIFADGAPTETFVDCDNRFMFHNASEFAALYPEDERPAWEFCAPRLEAGSAELTVIRAALLERAAGLGHALDSDPDLHLVVDGAVVRPDRIAGNVYRFAIPPGSRAAWLASRSVVPAEAEAAGHDIRRLGVAVERIVLTDGERSIEARHGDAALCDGFHEDEGSHRWTDGRARLPETWLLSFPGGARLDVHLTLTELGYRLPPPARIGAAAA